MFKTKEYTMELMNRLEIVQGKQVLYNMTEDNKYITETLLELDRMCKVIVDMKHAVKTIDEFVVGTILDDEDLHVMIERVECDIKSLVAHISNVGYMTGIGELSSSIMKVLMVINKLMGGYVELFADSTEDKLILIDNIAKDYEMAIVKSALFGNKVDSLEKTCCDIYNCDIKVMLEELGIEVNSMDGWSNDSILLYIGAIRSTVRGLLDVRRAADSIVL